MKIDTVIFDFGGVLVDWDPKYVYQQIFDVPEKMRWFLENICTDEWNLEQDRGRSLAEGTEILTRQFPEHDELIRAFYGRWKEMLKGEIRETVEILHELKKRYAVYGLTNWSAETFPVALERFDFFKVFDGIVVSGTEKLVKPDKAIFQLILDRYLLKAENSIFIDDNAKNITTANEMGFHAIHFENPEKLREKLSSMKLI
ncbi:MAG: HAD family phosphatase [Bacteroidota bacterium]|nr:HAD family phosphatase [Bacteroidota bacterium]